MATGRWDQVEYLLCSRLIKEIKKNERPKAETIGDCYQLGLSFFFILFYLNDCTTDIHDPTRPVGHQSFLQWVCLY